MEYFITAVLLLCLAVPFLYKIMTDDHKHS